MKLQELGEIIFKPSSNLMRKLGEELFKDGMVFNVKGKKIENLYNIYGDVSNGINENEFKTHIKINLSNKKLDSVSCTCGDFKEISADKELFMCEHLNATAYKFLSLLHKKKDSQDTSSKKLIEKSKEKIQVGIDVKISSKWWKGETNYELEFRIGVVHKYLITDLKNFIFDLDNKKSIYFNNQFTYNHKCHSIDSKDTKIIDFIRNYVNGNKGLSATGRNLIVTPNNLRKFLQCIEEKKIQFKYNAIEYKTNVFKKNLPISFTLKERNEQIILTTHKKLPIPLNSNKDVYFFNEQFYLPPKNQIKKYIYLCDRFQKHSEIVYKKTIENYNKIIFLLISISNDITLSEGIKRFSADLLRFNFLIYKEKNNIYCEVQGIYSNKIINILEDNNEMHIIRDLNKEEQALMKLEYYNFIKRENRLLFVGKDEDIFNLLNKRESNLNSLGTIILGNNLENLKVYDASSIKIDLYEDNDGFRFNYNMGAIEKTEFFNIFESYKGDNRFYKTKNNVFIDFEDEGVREFLNLIQVLDISKDLIEGSILIEKNKALYIIESFKNRDFNFGKGEELLNNIENKLIDINSKEVELPQKLKAILREYQVDGFKWFKNLNELKFGGILADEMGLGKTVQTIAFLVSEESKKTLIIAPTSLIYNWKDEIDRFAPTLKVGIAHGSGDTHKKLIDNLKEYDVILMTYGTLRNNIEKYNHIEFDYCIIDEAQNIKNPSAQITRIVKEIKAKIRFALTGTPIENNLTELWSIFDFVMPGYLYSKETFDEKFGYNGDCELADLKLLIKPFILRRTKKEVIKDLPDKIEKQILVEMTVAQKSVYNTYIKEVRAKMKNNTDGKIEVFSYLTKLRQICLDPAIILKDYEGDSGKLKVAMDLVEEEIASEGKMLIFSQFTSVLSKIGESLEKKAIDYFYLDGSTPSKERIRLVNEFNNSNKAAVFLISLKAGGTGLNLTSANLVIHFDPWWNPAVEDQATDRAHRIGQRNIVEVIKLVARGTIEEKIVLMQEHKKELIDNIITGELKNSNALNKLSKEELIQLFHRC